MKRDRDLPPGMYRKHGAIYLVRKNKWTKLGTTLEDALVEYARLQGGGKGSMGVLLDDYLKHLQTRKKPVAENTLKQYTYAASVLKVALEQFSPHNLKAPHVAKLLDHHGAKHPNMANRMRSVLLGAMNLAVRHGLAESNPVLSIERFEESQRERYITDEEFWKVYECASPVIRAMMKIQHLTGQRIRDVLSRKITDIEDDAIYFIQQKTGKRVAVRAPGMKEAIDEAKTARGNIRSFWLIPGPKGRQYSYKGAYDAWNRAAKKAGVKDARPNDLRAKAATDADDEGLNATNLLGHDSARTTKRYLRNRKTKVVAGPTLKVLRQS